MNSKAILENLIEIKDASTNSAKLSDFLNYAKLCLNPYTDSKDKSIGKVGEFYVNCHMYVTDITKYNKTVAGLRKFLEKLGYRSEENILTAQEHNLMGSTINYDDKYAPIGILTGALTLEEAITARHLKKVILAVPTFFGLPNLRNNVPISLEPLDSKGNTLRDPRPLDEKFQVMPDYKKSKTFPYRRD